VNGYVFFNDLAAGRAEASQSVIPLECLRILFPHEILKVTVHAMRVG
jgi:hypothetical protein